MDDFKLLAIRPLTGCDKKFQKILKPNRIYKFYNDYDFIYFDEDENKSVECIRYKLSAAQDIYSFLKKTDGAILPISIAAIVGKNGSGKSTLMELFFLMIYNLAVKNRILEYIEDANGQLEKLEPVIGLKLEIYYLLNRNIYCLKYNGQDEDSFQITEFVQEELKHEYYINPDFDNNMDLFNKPFFYSIAVNYSFYGLNSELIGNWIKGLFHKNDGYQTPVVISPYREEGNIEINNEIYLAKQRLLTNILRPTINANVIQGGLTEFQKVKNITFKISKNKIQFAYKKGGSEKSQISFEEFFEINNREMMLGIIYDAFFDSKEPNEIKYKTEVENYIIKKLIKIARTYLNYKEFFIDELDQNAGEIGGTRNRIIRYSMNFKTIEDFKEYLTKLKKDKSHITFKLRQAINYLKSDLLRDEKEKKLKWEKIQDLDDDESEFFRIPVEQLTNRILSIPVKQEEIIEFIPPSLFDIEIHLLSIDEKGIESESLFSTLSSGEQQLIHAVQGILYQINNVSSVFYDKTEGVKKVTYKYINLLLDEIELYFHPDYQRKFISYLFESLRTINAENILGINVLFLTHSPFILSDIPVTNILKLEEGLPSSHHPGDQTFCANINELLANNFLPKDAPVGEFAKKTVESLVQYLKVKDKEVNGWTEEKAEKVIKIVADHIIRMRLEDLFNQKFSKPMQSLYKEKEQLEKRLKQITKRIGNDSN